MVRPADRSGDANGVGAGTNQRIGQHGGAGRAVAGRQPAPRAGRALGGADVQQKQPFKDAGAGGQLGRSVVLRRAGRLSGEPSRGSGELPAWRYADRAAAGDVLRRVA